MTYFIISSCNCYLVYYDATVVELMKNNDDINKNPNQEISTIRIDSCKNNIQLKGELYPHHFRNYQLYCRVALGIFVLFCTIGSGIMFIVRVQPRIGLCFVHAVIRKHISSLNSEFLIL